ncbi:MAG TPA: zf-HC2 domain-containing protein [Vicinamibacterales bacterium]|jgi:anti-sigma factor RsiW|nr:zf-HC2 domain-containing protein [Vicinamibacterales bacterium]
MKEIACVSGVELLMDYLDGVLPADLHAALDEHVAGCPRCAAFVRSYCDTPRILRAATAATLPAELEASLQAFLRARTSAFKRS